MQAEDIQRLQDTEQQREQILIELEHAELLDILQRKLKLFSLLPNKNKNKLLHTFINKIDEAK